MWKVTLKHEVGLDDIAGALLLTDKVERMADEAFKLIIDRHPNQPQLMHLYGKFMEEVEGNVAAAAQIFKVSPWG